MQRNVSQNKELNDSNKKFIIPVHEEVSFKDIVKYLDVQMQDSIKKQLEGIDEEVEKLGKVCDKVYKKSYEEYKNILDKEREDLDNNVKKYISNLKDNLIGLRNRINYDYKGKYREINSKLSKLVEELKVTTKQSVKLQYKKNDLIEDCTFYEKQIDTMRDMNIYLKYKLKLFLGDIEEENNKNNKKIQKDEVNNNIKDETKKDLNKNEMNNDIRDEYNINKGKDKSSGNINNNDDKKENNEDEKSNEDKLYITATKNLYKSNKNKNAEFDEIGYLNSKLDLEELQLLNYIHHEKRKNAKLSEIYNTLFLKTQNKYFSCLTELIDEQKTINTSKSLEKNNLNDSSFGNNSSILPSILSSSQSLNENKKFYKPENPGPGYISRKENKEIILNFLENIDVKKAIYKLMYGETH